MATSEPALLAISFLSISRSASHIVTREIPIRPPAIADHIGPPPIAAATPEPPKTDANAFQSRIELIAPVAVLKPCFRKA